MKTFVIENYSILQEIKTLFLSRLFAPFSFAQMLLRGANRLLYKLKNVDIDCAKTGIFY